MDTWPSPNSMQLDMYYFSDEDIFCSPKCVHIRGVWVGVHGCTDTCIVSHFVQHCKAASCARRHHNLVCNLTHLLTNAPLQSVRFCYFLFAIVLHHWRFSGNLHITTIELAITFIYVTSVRIACGNIACRKNVQHLHTKYSSPLTALQDG